MGASVLSARRQSLSSHCSLAPPPLQLSPVLRIAASTRRPAVPTTSLAAASHPSRLAAANKPPQHHQLAHAHHHQSGIPAAAVLPTHRPPVTSLACAPVRSVGLLHAGCASHSRSRVEEGNSQQLQPMTQWLPTPGLVLGAKQRRWAATSGRRLARQREGRVLAGGSNFTCRPPRADDQCWAVAWAQDSFVPSARLNPSRRPLSCSSLHSSTGFAASRVPSWRSRRRAAATGSLPAVYTCTRAQTAPSPSAAPINARRRVPVPRAHATI